jgi:two-component system response regulator CpxR
MRPKKIILCVDDNEQELSVLKFMLATNGYRVVSASNGQEAIGIFAETPVDLVLTDFAMPQMNGCQLVERLKQIASHVPMILLGDPQRMAGEMHAADALLAKKNCSPQELLERIKVMSARKRGPRKGSQRQVPVEELAVASRTGSEVRDTGNRRRAVPGDEMYATRLQLTTGSTQPESSGQSPCSLLTPIPCSSLLSP